MAGSWRACGICTPAGTDQGSDQDEKRIDGLLARREEWGCRTQRGLELILTPRGKEWAIHPWVSIELRRRESCDLQASPRLVRSP